VADNKERRFTSADGGLKAQPPARESSELLRIRYGKPPLLDFQRQRLKALNT